MMAELEILKRSNFERIHPIYCAKIQAFEILERQVGRQGKSVAQ